MRVTRTSIFLGLSLSLLVNAPSATAAPLQPVKPWNIHSTDTDCLAERAYGSATDGLVLGFRPSPGGETYELIVGSKGSGDQYATQLRGTVDFGRRPIKASTLRYHPAGTQLIMYKYQISQAEMLAGASAQYVTLRNDHGPTESFALSSFPQVLKTLDQCNEDLRKFWNMTTNVVSVEAKPLPDGDLRRIFTWKDYPDEALFRDVEGAAQFLVLVSERGDASNCYVEKASGSPALDGMGCQVIMQRAKFKPALDRQGKAVRSTVTSPPIVWRIEG